MIVNRELAEILDSRMYENSKGVVFKSPKEILQPFLDKVSPFVDNDNYRIKYSVGSINRNIDGTSNIAYDKLITEFELSVNGNAGEYSNICLAYDLNNKVPIYKVASGYTIRTCLNMCIVSDYDLFVTDDHTKASQKLVSYINELSLKEQAYLSFKNHLENRKIDINQVEKVIGNLIYNIENKYLKSFVLESVDDLKNSKSNYYIENNETTLWNVYNCITQQISNQFNKKYIDYPSLTTALSNKIMLN
ncbi:MAG TPA: hypothetical protein PKD00_00250 [Burkholderiales bacterium]|nr:hypothetical protein [Burkholderiales bacterium]